MSEGIKVRSRVHFRTMAHGQRRIVSGDEPLVVSCRVPRVTRIMALAIRFEELIRTGVVADQAELARLGHVTRARVTQIMTLLQLAPDIQEQILLLPLTEFGREPIQEHETRQIATESDWV